MDPLHPTNTPAPETEGTTNSDEQPERILDIIREVTQVQPQSVPTAAVPTPASSHATPQKSAPAATATKEEIPTLESMGGTRPQEKNTPGSSHAAPVQSKPGATLVTDAKPSVKMTVYTPDYNANKSTPQDKGSATPVFTEGLRMKDIALPKEDKAPAQTFDTTSGTPSSKDSPATPEPDATKGTGKQSSEYIIPSIHTLRDDMQHVVRNESMSIVRATAKQEEKRHAKEKAAVQRSSGTPKKRSPLSILIPISIGLFVVGASALGGFFWYKMQQEAPILTQEEAPSLIFVEQTQPISVSNTSASLLKQTLNTSFRNNTAISPGSVVRILPTYTSDTALGQESSTRIATPGEFFDALAITTPAEMKAALGQDFFLGIHSQSGNQFVLILSVSSYERAFAAMLNWEPSMSTALSTLFPDIPGTVIQQDGSVIENTFTDVVIKNFDVRMLADGSGTPRLFYTFPNRDYLVITSNQYTLIEILARLQAARTL